jgi:hypothetical protein
MFRTSIVAVVLALAFAPAIAQAETQLTFRGPFNALTSGSTTFVTIEATHAGGDLANLRRERYAPGDASYSVALVTPTNGCAVNPSFSLSKFSRNVLSQFSVERSHACALFFDAAKRTGLQWRITDGSATALVTVSPSR